MVAMLDLIVEASKILLLGGKELTPTNDPGFGQQSPRTNNTGFGRHATY